ncbi:hypothetical protein FNV43_RR19964 [Rhamnella rubrinervis]|uniref:S-adenosylmethionine-dependent methyltransferase n=1 Tax=Rhamnella rubrinervis TaxID=2594499 RepID=A0A8K0DV20_9ROSA|nr:hypothetical protein FNV43_RR19964 [Rhamnella rubrinervis]
MAAEQSMELHEAYPMTGGDGLYSYVNNSSGQIMYNAFANLLLPKAVIDSAKELVKRAIVEKLDKEILCSFKTFRIADLGCSVGPNTYFAVQNILEALESKYQQCHQIPEFQVFYSDHVGVCMVFELNFTREEVNLHLCIG